MIDSLSDPSSIVTWRRSPLDVDERLGSPDGFSCAISNVGVIEPSVLDSLERGESAGEGNTSFLERDPSSASTAAGFGFEEGSGEVLLDGPAELEDEGIEGEESETESFALFAAFEEEARAKFSARSCSRCCRLRAT